MKYRISGKRRKLDSHLIVHDYFHPTKISQRCDIWQGVSRMMNYQISDYNFSSLLIRSLNDNNVYVCKLRKIGRRIIRRTKMHLNFCECFPDHKDFNQKFFAIGSPKIRNYTYLGARIDRMSDVEASGSV